VQLGLGRGVGRVSAAVSLPLPTSRSNARLSPALTPATPPPPTAGTQVAAINLRRTQWPADYQQEVRRSKSCES
jgi:hypothetical protein